MFFPKQIKVLVFLALLIASGASCQNTKKDSVPKPVGFVNDFEDIFSTSQEEFLDSMIGAYQEKTTIQIALITVDTLMISREGFENYILKIANTWGVGQKEKNNGITIGISRGYRAMRIQNGYGIKKVLSDSETKSIVDAAFIPYLRKGNTLKE